METLIHYNPCEYLAVIIAMTVSIALFFIPGVLMPRYMVFDDEFSYFSTSWHVKASYIIVAISEYRLLDFGSALSTATDQGDSDNHTNGDEGRELLPTLGQGSESVMVATDDKTASDRHLEEGLPKVAKYAVNGWKHMCAVTFYDVELTSQPFGSRK
eukprot:CAMPEP_0183707402 /NCGR_PEP_ID=MMETSP0737-20130205/3986_1 /TAXON_ID=385413 /ORGANISM="Thalassiosira miniscula, Strain CCMP1093" /LENGTH=156 /DNA_ID=CAMNT_0025935053 /DNA_START=278 /DNA_END=745 /DNA_ORIENTATION=+